MRLWGWTKPRPTSSTLTTHHTTTLTDHSVAFLHPHLPHCSCKQGHLLPQLLEGHLGNLLRAFPWGSEMGLVGIIGLSPPPRGSPEGEQGLGSVQVPQPQGVTQGHRQPVPEVVRENGGVVTSEGPPHTGQPQGRALASQNLGAQRCRGVNSEHVHPWEPEKVGGKGVLSLSQCNQHHQAEGNGIQESTRE